MCDVLLPNELRHSFGNAASRQTDHGCSQVLSELDVLLQRTPVIAVLIARRVNVHDIKFSVDPMRHSAATRDQVLCHWI